jgi:hypothetical protein
MATFTKLALQPAGTTGTGLGILVAATSTAGTAIHTASATATTIDEIWLYAVNTHTSDIKLTIEWGEATEPNGNIEYTVKAENGLYLIVPGLLLQGNATAKVVRAFAATANEIVIHGYVNRITA